MREFRKLRQGVPDSVFSHQRFSQRAVEGPRETVLEFLRKPLTKRGRGGGPNPLFPLDSPMPGRASVHVYIYSSNEINFKGVHN